MAVSVMQMTTTRPTGTFSTHFAQRLLSTSVSLYLRLSHLAALRLSPVPTWREQRVLSMLCGRCTGFEPARVCAAVAAGRCVWGGCTS